MESVIKWHTGEPKKAGTYIVTLENGLVFCDDYYCYMTLDGKVKLDWRIVDSSDILAWCPLSEIEPYKE